MGLILNRCPICKTPSYLVVRVELYLHCRMYHLKLSSGFNAIFFHSSKSTWCCDGQFMARPIISGSPITFHLSLVTVVPVNYVSFSFINVLMKCCWHNPQVRERCRKEWTMFQGRMAEAEKAYFKEMGITFNSTNR